MVSYKVINITEIGSGYPSAIQLQDSFNNYASQGYFFKSFTNDGQNIILEKVV